MKDAVEACTKPAPRCAGRSAVRGTASDQLPIREDALNKITQANGGMRLQPVDAPGLDSNLQDRRQQPDLAVHRHLRAPRRREPEDDDDRDRRRAARSC